MPIPLTIIDALGVVAADREALDAAYVAKDAADAALALATAAKDAADNALAAAKVKLTTDEAALVDLITGTYDPDLPPAPLAALSLSAVEGITGRATFAGSRGGSWTLSDDQGEIATGTLPADSSVDFPGRTGGLQGETKTVTVTVRSTDGREATASAAYIISGDGTTTPLSFQPQ